MPSIVPELFLHALNNDGSLQEGETQEEGEVEGNLRQISSTLDLPKEKAGLEELEGDSQFSRLSAHTAGGKKRMG